MVPIGNRNILCLSLTSICTLYMIAVQALGMP